MFYFLDDIKQRCRSDCVNAQTGLHVCCLHATVRLSPGPYFVTCDPSTYMMDHPTIILSRSISQEKVEDWLSGS